MDEEAYWQAVLDRDKSFDGAFVYGVSSTGVYCKATCPSRRPSRENVTFFSGPDDAEIAGFRACLRCYPKGRTEPEPGVALAEKASRYIEEKLEGGQPEDLTLEAIGKHVQVSPFHLQRVFKRVMGITPRQYAASLRLERLKSGLREGDSVTGAMYSAGYGSSNHLYSDAGAQMGMTPSAYRKGGTGMEIKYTVLESTVGKVLVAATERGLCAVQLGDSDEALASHLHREYPAAHVARDDATMSEWAQPILSQLKENKPYLEGAATLPLDVSGTPFQLKVWAELKAIPYGSTRSYGQVAQAIGNKSAVRAVAQACGANHVAIVIPCHRVIGSDGSLGGYKWGVERKKELLASEAAGK